MVPPGAEALRPRREANSRATSERSPEACRDNSDNCCWSSRLCSGTAGEADEDDEPPNLGRAAAASGMVRFANLDTESDGELFSLPRNSCRHMLKHARRSP